MIRTKMTAVIPNSNDQALLTTLRARSAAQRQRINRMYVWLTHPCHRYKDLRVAFSPEITAVSDRMLAPKTALAIASMQQRLAPLARFNAADIADTACNTHRKCPRRHGILRTGHAQGREKPAQNPALCHAGIHRFCPDRRQERPACQRQITTTQA